VPVQVALIAVMPVTGVGKIYKPALRLEAAQRAFAAAIAPLQGEGVAAAVTVRNDPTHGMLAVVGITVSATASREAIVKRCSELLGGFQIRHAVEFVPGAT
jgi:fatty-acyl-CoA synthase